MNRLYICLAPRRSKYKMWAVPQVLRINRNTTRSHPLHPFTPLRTRSHPREGLGCEIRLRCLESQHIYWHLWHFSNDILGGTRSFCIPKVANRYGSRYFKFWCKTHTNNITSVAGDFINIHEMDTRIVQFLAHTNCCLMLGLKAKKQTACWPLIPLYNSWSQSYN